MFVHTSAQSGLTRSMVTSVGPPLTEQVIEIVGLGGVGTAVDVVGDGSGVGSLAFAAGDSDCEGLGVAEGASWEGASTAFYPDPDDSHAPSNIGTTSKIANSAGRDLTTVIVLPSVSRRMRNKQIPPGSDLVGDRSRVRKQLLIRALRAQLTRVPPHFAPLPGPIRDEANDDGPARSRHAVMSSE